MLVSNVGMVILYALLPVFKTESRVFFFASRRWKKTKKMHLPDLMSISPLSVHVGDQKCVKTIPWKSSVLITFGEDYYILSVQVLYKQIREPTRIIRGTLFQCKYSLHYFSHHTIFPYSLRFILCSILIRESKTLISRRKNQWLVGSLFFVVSFTTSIFFHGLTMIVDTDDQV